MKNRVGVCTILLFPLVYRLFFCIRASPPDTGEGGAARPEPSVGRIALTPTLKAENLALQACLSQLQKLLGRESDSGEYAHPPPAKSTRTGLRRTLNDLTSRANPVPAEQWFDWV